MIQQIDNFSMLYVKELSRSVKPRSLRTWQRGVDDLYHHTCIVTRLGAKDVTLQRHHLYSVNTHPQLRLIPANGVVLCKPLHLHFHRIYGNNVTPLEFMAFVKVLKKEKLKGQSDYLSLVIQHIENLDNLIAKEYL